MKRFFILLMVFPPLVVNAQNTVSKKIDANIKLSTTFLSTDHIKSYTYAKKAVDESKSGTADDKIKSISNFINILIEKGDFPAARQYLYVLKHLSEQNNLSKGLFDYYFHSGSVLIQEGFYKEAEKAIDTSFSIARQNNFQDTGQLIYNLAQIDIAALKVKPAMIKLEKAYSASANEIMLMRLCKISQLPYTGINSKSNAASSGLDTIIANLKTEKNLFMLGQLFGMLGGAYLLNFNFPLAAKNYMIADEYFEKINSPFYQGSNMLAWSQVLAMQNKTDSALKLNRLIIEKFEKLNYKLGLSMAHMYAGSFYNKLKDTANAKKHRELSEKYNTESKNTIIHANNMLQLANEKRGDNKNSADETVNKAIKLFTEFTKENPGLIKLPVVKDSSNTATILKNLETLINEIDFIKDSITQKKNADVLQELETKYQTRQIKDSLRIQNQQLELNEIQFKLKDTQKKNLWIGIGSLVLLLGIIGYLLRTKLKQNKDLVIEKNKVSNLMGILKHETIRQFGNLDYSLTKILHTTDPQRQVAKALVEAKSYNHLYSLLFASSKMTGISLKTLFTKLFEYNCTEMGVLQEPAFSIVGDLVIDFKNSDFLVIYMNELIANSLEHAFDNVKEPSIAIHIDSDEENIIIGYKDNGNGVPEQVMAQPLEEGKGLYYVHVLAEQNLKGRLETNFENGSRYTLTMKKMDN